MINEIRSEAARLKYSLSEIVQRAWTLAKEEIHKLPSDIEK